MLKQIFSRLFPQPVTVTPTVAEPAQETCDEPIERSPDQELRDRYEEQLRMLLNDAVERKSARILVDAITWTLARIVVGYGSTAAGHTLERLGGYICLLAEQQNAEREAKDAKSEGRKPH